MLYYSANFRDRTLEMTEAVKGDAQSQIARIS
jgi:hypothetical protein